MRASLLKRCTGVEPSLPSRYTGAAVAVLIGVGLVTAPARVIGKPTPDDVIGAAAATSPAAVGQLRGGVAMLAGSDGDIGVSSQPGGALTVAAGIVVSNPKSGRRSPSMIDAVAAGPFDQ